MRGSVNRLVAVYIIILVFGIVFALYFSGYIKLGIGTTTTVTTSIYKTSTTTIHANATTTNTVSSQTTTVAFSSCLSKNATTSILNGNFSSGTYYGWNVSGPGFGSAPFNITYANSNNIYYAAPWSGYNGIYIATTYHGGLALQAGNLTSKPFEVTQLYLNFKVISPQSSLLYVEILRNKTPIIVTHYNTLLAPNNTNAATRFENASIPLATLLCQNVSIRIVAGVVGTPTIEPSYIAVGDFYMGRVPVSTLGIVINQSIS
jgi:hypothetical protein